MSGHGEKLTRKQESAIAALLCCRTIEEAAQSVKIAFSTLVRWMKQKEFSAAYLEARRAVVSKAVSRLCQATTSAVDTLEEVAANEKAKDSARVSAAKAILDLSIRAVELEDLAERVKLLEERYGSSS